MDYLRRLVAMLTVLIGLSSALIFGAADFLGGIASKRISPIRVTAVSALTGFALLLLLLPFLGGRWSPEALLLGSLSGVTGGIAIGLLYACLAVGPMSILSPLTAVISAIVPLSVSLLGGASLKPIGYVGLGLALVAVVLVGFVPEKGAVRPSLRGVLMAIGSGTAIGLFLVIIDKTPDDSGIIPLVANRGVSALLMFATVGLLALLALRRKSDDAAASATTPRTGWRAGLVLAIACGLVDAIANVGLLLGVRLGDLPVMAVLTALYPAGTIILAAIVLKERIAPVQVVGLVLAIIAGAMFALA